jgi:glucosamine-6-phosphate deaminase
MNSSSAPRHFVVDRLAVEVHADPAAMGRAAARAVAAHLGDVIAAQGDARVIFACAPSQDAFLAALLDPAQAGRVIRWDRVTAFHMDDYVGLGGDHPQSFRHYLQRHLLDRVNVREFHPLHAEERDSAGVCARYGERLAESPIDLICLGIGENGHIAFNDPPVADFDDAALVKVVELDAACRAQQVNDGCFAALDRVPRQALTLTIPVFRHARRLSVVVPGPRKADAIRATLRDPISTACPATILRTHPNATLYVDAAAAARA